MPSLVSTGIYGQSCTVTRPTAWQLVGKDLFEAVLFSVQRGCRRHLGTLQPLPTAPHGTRPGPHFESATVCPSNRTVPPVCPHAPIHTPPVHNPYSRARSAVPAPPPSFPYTLLAVEAGPHAWFVLHCFPCGITHCSSVGPTLGKGHCGVSVSPTTDAPQTVPLSSCGPASADRLERQERSWWRDESGTRECLTNNSRICRIWSCHFLV